MIVNEDATEQGVGFSASFGIFRWYTESGKSKTLNSRAKNRKLNLYVSYPIETKIDDTLYGLGFPRVNSSKRAKTGVFTLKASESIYAGCKEIREKIHQDIKESGRGFAAEVYICFLDAYTKKFFKDKY
jgi:hypothetical protein